jgi:Ran GTPase-activating protein 1
MLRLDSVSDVLCIVEAVEGCERMVTLCLEGNTLGVEAAKELAKSLESQPFVENVLFNNLFTGRLKSEIPEVLLYMTSGLMLSSAKLDTLDLSDNAIGPVGMPSLLPFLESHSCETLKTLRLNNCGLGVGGGQILAKGLVRLKSLKTLVCGRNRLEILGSQAIGNALTEY